MPQTIDNQNTTKQLEKKLENENIQNNL